MNYAPIILFTYCRPDHVKRTVEALLRNPEAADSDLYIYSDAPQNSAAESGVHETRSYIRTIDGFKSKTIVEREVNYGLAKNLIDGITTVVNKHGSIIVVEDDIVTSPFFLGYMNDALDKYKGNNKVGSIHGYAMMLNGNLPEVFLTPWVGCWGWATWKNRWEYFNPNGKELFDKIASSRPYIKKFDFDYSSGFTKMLHRQVNGEINSWAIRWSASNLVQGRYSLQPSKSLVQQIGMDGGIGATHSNKTNIYDVELISKPIILPPSEELNAEDIDGRNALIRFFSSNMSFTLKIRAYIEKIGLRPLFSKLSQKLSWI